MKEIPFYRVSLLREPGGHRVELEGRDQCIALCRERLANEPCETVLVLCTDSYLNVIGAFIPYRGGMDNVFCEPRGVFVPALLMHASGVVIAHNHPGGKTQPSKNDIDLTRRMLFAANILGIELHDHFIIGEDEAVFSIREAVENQGLPWDVTPSQIKNILGVVETAE